MDMLAELYYHEADMVGQPTRDELLNKAFMLFDYVETHGDTFDLSQKLFLLCPHLRRSVPFFVLYDSFSAMVRRKRFISAS